MTETTLARLCSSLLLLSAFASTRATLPDSPHEHFTRQRTAPRSNQDDYVDALTTTSDAVELGPALPPRTTPRVLPMPLAADATNNEQR